jgi:hypothetical protein
MIELLKQYVDTGLELSKYQLDKIKNHRNLLITYLRKREIAIQNNYDKFSEYEIHAIIYGHEKKYFNDDMIKSFININKNFKFRFEDTEEWEKIDFVQRNKMNIIYIKNPSEDVQIESVKNHPESIKYIKNPSEKVQMVAVKSWTYSIQYIENPTEKVKLTAVERNPNTIGIIENPSEEIQLMAVQLEPRTISHIKNPYPSVNNLFKSLNHYIDNWDNPYL